MIRQQSSLSAVTLLFLLTGLSFLHLSSPNPLYSPGDSTGPHRPAIPGLIESGDGERKDEERQSVQKGEEENEDELFKDVDPKTLAAVLVEALKSRDGDDMNASRGKVKKDEASEGANRDRDGRQELELLMAAQGEEQDREEAEKRRIAQEEEEKMTEKVTSHTTSQTVQVQNKQWWDKDNERAGKGPDGAGQQGPEQGSNEQEEQLNPEELKSLETMMKEFPRLHTFTKREKESEQKQRASRRYSNYNDVIPMNKGSDLAMSKKKLKWQEETQKAMNFPTFTGGNFMNEFEDSNFVGGDAAQPQDQAEQATEADDSREQEEEDEEEEEEEMLSPEEEEAQAKAEQEEMRRQAAEAQRAKMEEEKLADIASDMLLRYMVKQNHGNKKYSLSLSNGAEDKRSNEDQEATEEEDIDPQTIDKLIEISTKLHLPADDVVDIISDVEKKKKKDVTPEMTSRWQQPVMPLSASSLVSDFSVSKANQKGYSVSKQLSPPVNPLKTWFQRKMPPNPQDIWAKPAKPNANLWSKAPKTLSVDHQDFWPKPPMSGYPVYPFTYRPYYQRKPYPGYYPVPLPPPTRLKPRYYVPKPALAFNGFVGNAMDDAYIFPPRRQYNSWIQPRLRKPPMALQHRPYYTNYPLPMYTRTFLPMPLSKPHPPVRVPPQTGQFYFSSSEPERQDDSMVVKQPDRSSIHGNLEKYIEQMLLKQAHMLD